MSVPHPNENSQHPSHPSAVPPSPPDEATNDDDGLDIPGFLRRQRSPGDVSTSPKAPSLAPREPAAIAGDALATPLRPAENPPAAPKAAPPSPAPRLLDVPKPAPTVLSASDASAAPVTPRGKISPGAAAATPDESAGETPSTSPASAPHTPPAACDLDAAAGIQLFVTKDMKAKLLALGWSLEDIFEMPPKEARRIIAESAKPAAANPSPFGIAEPRLATPDDPDISPILDSRKGAPAAGGDRGAVASLAPSPSEGAPSPPKPGASKLEAALAMAARGVRIFPIPPNQKEANLDDWPGRSTSDPERIKRCWAENPDRNYGAHGDGLVIVDTDEKIKDGIKQEGNAKWREYCQKEQGLAEPPRTFTVRTTTGGRHHYFRMPPGMQVGNPQDVFGGHSGVDIKGWRGYVVGPGSTIDGKAYEIIDDCEMVEAPDWLIALAGKAKARAENASKEPEETPEGVAGAQNYIENHAPRAVDGAGGNAAANKAMNRLLDFPISNATAEEKARWYNENKCDPPWDDDDMVRRMWSLCNSREHERGWWRADTEIPFEPIEEVGEPPRSKAPIDGSKAPWEDEPADLWASSAKPPELPQGAVPELIERLARSQGRRLGVEPGALAAASLCAFGSLVSARNQLQMKQIDPEWKIRTILWVMPVGDVSSKKTAIFNCAMKPVRHVDAQWRRAYAEAKRQERHQKHATPESSDDVFEGELVEPTLRQKEVNDATTEAQGHLLAQNPSGIIYASDELSGWIGSMDAYRAKGGKDRPFYLDAKGGGPRTIIRRGAKPIVIPTLAISILGGIQPAKIAPMAGDLDTDGLLQRFLPIMIRVEGRGLDELPDADADTKAAALAMAITQAEQEGLFKFAPEAASNLEVVQDFTEREVKRADISQAMASWLGKLPAEYGRLALAFHFIESCTSQLGATQVTVPELISQETAQRARRFVLEFLVPHGRVFYGEVFGQSGETHAKWVAEYILSRGHTRIRRRELERAYFKPSRYRKGELQFAMRDLEAMGWVRVTVYRGEPSEWEVNPAVHDGRFAEVAAFEKKRRAETRAQIAQTAAERRDAA
jgi:Protein of unknown function (DUF3987)/Bifunctional DNA primase/polymerase, N-terminal